MKKTIALTYIAIIITLFSNNLHAQKIKLRLNVEEGERYTTISKMNQEIEQTIMGMGNNLTQNINMEMTATITDVNQEGNVLVDYVYDGVTYEHISNIGEINYDSKAGDNSKIDPSAVGFAALIGEKLTVKMTEFAEVIGSSGLDNVSDNAVRLLKIEDSSKQEEMKKEFDKTMNPERLTASFSANAPFPEEAIEVGSTWEHDIKTNNGYPLQIHSKYTVTSITADFVELSINSTISSASDGTMQMNKMEIEHNLSGTQNGIQIIHRDNGWIKETKFTQDISGTMTILPNESIPDGITFPMKIKSDVQLTSEKL